MSVSAQPSTPVDRQDVAFPVAGVTCRAWLYRPPSSAPRPVIVMAHGLAGTREMRLDAFAERFCAAGYACLVFDYRHFGASDGEPRQLLSIERQLADWKAAVAWSRARPDVDGNQVVLWGTSFGGGHVLRTAAEVPGIHAVVSQCPFTDGLASALALDPRSSVKVTAAALADLAGSLVGRAPLFLPNAGPAGTAAFMTAPDALAGIQQLVPVGARLRTDIAARFGLDIIRYFPGRAAAAIPCPVLFCVCEHDTVAPSEATLRHARKAPRGEVKVYADGHFDLYVGDAFERVVRDQLAFLERTTPWRSTTSRG